VPSTLIVTNDFPPRPGGIQSFVYELARRLPAEELTVYASNFPGAADFDAQQPFAVHRHPTGLLLPTPAAQRRITALARRVSATAAWFGAAAPLAVLAPALRRAGVQKVVASTHGHEAAWAQLPAARSALRRIGRGCDVVTYLGDYTRSRLERAFVGQVQLERLTPGVDVETFAPRADGSSVRVRHGLADRPVVVCVSRLVKRKGQDVLIEALPALRRRHPGTALLLVGRGPDEARLHRLAAQRGVSEHVVFTGAVPASALPAYFAAGDVFAMPCRTRRAGLDVEGLGIVYLEASATARPVLAGDSGGAPDAVRDGETGYVVAGRDVAAVTDRLTLLLDDPGLRDRLGAAGRDWVCAQWTWTAAAQRLARLLRE
jgi:phosphatidylinositol alpha-1,6-mannosyltransferase